MSTRRYRVTVLTLSKRGSGLEKPSVGAFINYLTRQLTRATMHANTKESASSSCGTKPKYLLLISFPFALPALGCTATNAVPLIVFIIVTVRLSYLRIRDGCVTTKSNCALTL